MAYLSLAEKLLINLMVHREPDDVVAALRAMGCTKHDVDRISDVQSGIISGVHEFMMPEELREIAMMPVFEPEDRDDLDNIFEMKTNLNVNLPVEEIEHLRAKLVRRMFGLDAVQMPLKEKKFLAELLASIQVRLDLLPSVEWTHSSSPQKEAAVILLSDHHFGKLAMDHKKNVVYNSDIARYRIGELLPKRVIKLLTRYLQPSEIDEVHILLLGDIVDGSGIYPGQELNQDTHSFIDQTADAVACIWNLIRAVRAEGWPVVVRGVRGNHGRQHKYAILENNFDYLVLQQLQLISRYEDQGVDVDFGPEEYYNHVIKGWNIHMRHEAPEQPETPARKAKFAGWKDIHEFDIMVYGHKHHPANTTYQESPLFMNASPIEIDDLAERMATKSRPSQTLFGISTKWGQTFHYNVYLDEVDANGNKVGGNDGESS